MEQFDDSTGLRYRHPHPCILSVLCRLHRRLRVVLEINGGTDQELTLQNEWNLMSDILIGLNSLTNILFCIFLILPIIMCSGDPLSKCIDT